MPANIFKFQLYQLTHNSAFKCIILAKINIGMDRKYYMYTF